MNENFAGKKLELDHSAAICIMAKFLSRATFCDGTWLHEVDDKSTDQKQLHEIQELSKQASFLVELISHLFRTYYDHHYFIRLAFHLN